MGQRELLLLLGAITLFGVTLVTTNLYVLSQNETVIQREYEYYAMSLAQTYIEEAKTRAFDVAVINASPSLPSGFTDPNALGHAYGEYYPNFNDIDDYHGYADTVSTSRGDFVVTIQVGYVQENNPSVVVNTKTFYKAMTVSVSNDFLSSPVTAHFVFGYIKN
jgi:hypothetical protein